MNNIDGYQIISNFLNANTKFHREMLQLCQIGIVVDDMLIVCPSVLILKALILRKNHICKALYWQNTIKRITMVSGNVCQTFPVHCFLLGANTMIQVNNSQIITTTDHDKDLIYEVLNFEGAASIVDFNEDKGLFSSHNIEIGCGVNANAWVGKNMASYWIPEELNLFKQRLNKERQLTNYKYHAYRMTGELAEFEVTARMDKFRNSLVRVVKTLAYELK